VLIFNVIIILIFLSHLSTSSLSHFIFSNLPPFITLSHLLIKHKQFFLSEASPMKSIFDILKIIQSPLGLPSSVDHVMAAPFV
jgi:hypothetical protein